MKNDFNVTKAKKLESSSPAISKRRGGRPLRYGEPTKLCRIPLSFEPVLSVLLMLWEKTRDVEEAKLSLVQRAKRLREMADFFEDCDTFAKLSGGKNGKKENL
ncbi:MAG: hypothetical protein LBU34_10550 [Planctomycetaceae bacterium]|jgi:hypothetical protein|nr:hypothetical protein [Planctomycetaceae bacterium]